MFKSGFVNIIGKPNVGKSTLMNQLVGERLSIITSKAQTTRHRILGILTTDKFQIIYSDTPGMIKPSYKMQESMMSFVNESIRDADVLIFVTDPFDKIEEETLDRLSRLEIPVIAVLNKTDLKKNEALEEKEILITERINPTRMYKVSALEGKGVDEVFDAIIELLPEHPPYYPADSLTDKPERFFASEIVREKIFLNYKKEVPYSTEVVITEFLEDEDIIRIRAEIYVERKSQKGIIIGKGGEALKKVGIAAREDLEKFFGKQVHIETYVKVADDWRKKDQDLRRFGY